MAAKPQTPADAHGWWDALPVRLESHLQEHQRTYIVLFTFAYLIPAAMSASAKPLWYDELFTYYIAQLGGTSEIWTALATGADIHPPLDYWLRNASMRMFGPGNLWFRLPSLIAFWIALLCLFRFTTARTSAACGFIALLVPFSTPAYPYAYEGRAYALVLAFTGISLISWDAAQERKRAAPFVFALSLIAAVYSHYYGVLLFVAFGIAELVRSLSRRSLHRRVWVSMAFAGAVCLTLLPLAATARRTTGTFWTPVSAPAALAIYPALFRLLLLPTIALLPLFAWSRHLPADAQKRPGPEISDVVLATSLLLFPLYVYILAKFATGALLERYALPAVLGAAILVAFAIAALSKAVLRVMVLAALALMFIYAELSGYRYVSRQERAIPIGAVTQLAEQNDIIVIGDMQSFFQIAHLSAPDVRRKIVYLTDVDASVEWKRTATGERLLQHLRQRSQLQIEDYKSFLRANRSFLLALPGTNWQTKQLLQDGATLSLQQYLGGEPLYRIEFATGNQ